MQSSLIPNPPSGAHSNWNPQILEFGTTLKLELIEETYLKHYLVSLKLFISANFNMEYGIEFGTDVEFNL